MGKISLDLAKKLMLKSAMRNIKLTLQYDGSGFVGLELQPGKKTIRGELEKALFKLFKTRIKVITASRTDSGVHALCQVVNFKIKHSIPTSRLVTAINSVLPEGIRIIKASLDSARDKQGRGFHARYHTKSKEYEYLIVNGQILPPFYRNFVWHVKLKLNLTVMRKAAKVLVGKHDFSSFCAAGGDDKNFVRKLFKITITKRTLIIWDSCKLEVVSCKLIGNGFLYKMVRNMVGTLIDVGLGKTSVNDMKRILKAKDRRKAGRTAPAQGLCLVKINY